MFAFEAQCFRGWIARSYLTGSYSEIGFWFQGLFEGSVILLRCVSCALAMM